MTIPPDPHRSTLQQAYTLAQQGDRAGALALLYPVVSAVPNHRDAWWLIAQVEPRPEAAAQALTRVLQIDPSFTPARERAARLGLTLTPPTASAPPPARDYVSHPEPHTPLVAERPPASIPRPAPARPAAAPPEDYYIPPRKPRMSFAEEPERKSGIQPFLAINGGCASGCLSGLFTLLFFAVLAFLILRSSVGIALRGVGALAPDQAVPASLIPAIMATAVLQLLRANPINIPIDLSGLIPGLDPAMLPQLPNSSQVFSQAMNGLWQSMGYAPYTGDAVISQMAAVGPQVQTFTWLLPLLFLGGWAALAFLIVFLRARRSRFLNWAVSTLGLWIIGGVAYAAALLIYRLFGGGMT